MNDVLGQLARFNRSLPVLGALGLAALVPGCAKERPVAANTRETALTTGPGERLNPMFSPDGRWLAYTERSQADQVSVCVMPAGGGETKRLLPASSQGSALGWTADSQGIEVWFPSEFRIRVYNLQGELLRERPAVPKAQLLDLSPDGRRTLWYKLNGDSYDVGLLGEADSTWHAVEATPEWETDACFGPGPDGITLVRQASLNAPNSDLGVFSIAHRTWTPLPLPKARNQEPAWDPAQMMLAFISNRAGSQDLWIYDSRNTRLLQITSGPEDEIDPTWSPDGARVVFGRKVTSSHIFAADPRTLVRTQITEGESRDYYPRCSPDGRWVAFFRRLPARGTGPVDTRLCVMSAAAKSPVTPLDLGGLTPTIGNWMFAWSPDAASLVFAADDGTGNVDLYRVPREGEHPDRITIASGLDIIPNWSPDGKQIAYTRLAGGETQIWTIPATGGLAVQISHNDGASEAPIWAPDSNHLTYLCLRGAVSEVHVTSVQNPDENRALLVTQDGLLPVAWSAEGDLVLFLHEKANAWSIDGVPVSGGPPFQVAEGKSDGFFAEFDPRFEGLRERVYPGNLNVFEDGERFANLISIDVSRILAQGLQAARD